VLAFFDDSCATASGLGTTMLPAQSQAQRKGETSCFMFLPDSMEQQRHFRGGVESVEMKNRHNK
jgi:hypothetical protein